MAQSNLAKIIPIRAGMEAGSTPALERLEKTSKEVDAKQQGRDEKLIKANEKLVTNLEKLASAIKAGAISPNAAPNYKDGGTWDQRSVKDQAKDKLLGRMGSDGKRDQFDKDSLKYKFGSLKGLSRMNNFVKEDSFVGNLIGRREDKLKRADTLMKMNPQMKNLKQFKGDDEKVRDYYIKQHEEQFAPAQAKAQSEKYKLDSMLQSGINPDELAKSVGGKRQMKAVETAQADELLKDKFRKNEVKGVLDGMAGAVGVPSSKQPSDSNVIPFPTQQSSGGGLAKESELENIRLMGSQNEMISSMKENTASFPIYLEEWREENKEVVKRHEQLIQAIAAGGSGGGGIMDMAGDMLGKGKGAMGKVGGLLKGAGGALMKRAGPLAAVASVVAGGVTAYQGYNAADEKEKQGKITKEEATVEKGGAIGEGGGQAVGGAVGALKGAAVGAAVGSVIPVVGTAIGGLVGAAIGGIGGSYLGGKAGKFLGETGGKIKNWFSSSNPDKSGAESKVQSMTATPQAQTDPKVVPPQPSTEAKGRGVAAFDKAYQEARSDGKSVKEAKEIAAAARKNAEKGESSQAFPLKEEKSSQSFPLKQAESGGSEKVKAITATAAPKVGASSVASSDREQKAEAARQNALADGASPEEANAIAEKMRKYGNVISAGQGRGDVYQPVPTSANIKPQKRDTADKVAQMTTENAAAKETPAQTNNVSTNVSNTSVKQSSTQAIKPPIRNQDSSFYNMVESRYVY